ncbi:helix-turn-helix transcriptional regulator [Streptomyces chartreusis]|uniref:helix-turn-helix transcriptional regulator n=1 Tax=Streptomyces chartreusis TaxID=1969 RepID=UPI00363D1D54
MTLACEHLNHLPADPAGATTVAPLAGAPVLLEEEDLTILRLIAAGRRRIDIAGATFSSITKIDARTRRLCHVLAADNRQHLAALGAVYGLVTRERLPSVPSTQPHVSEDDQDVLDLVVAGLSNSRIAARFQCDIDPVNTAMARLTFAFGADNRCQLAALAVLLEMVTCRAVSPRFPATALSGLPPFHVTTTGTGVLLHATPPLPSVESAGRSAAGSVPPVRAPDPTEAGRGKGPVTGSRGGPAPFPPELATWVNNYVGRHPTWELPNDSSGARCWRMSSPEGIIELRVPRTHGDLQREVAAHRHAIGRLGAGQAPRLLGFDPRLRALLTRQPRGERVDDAPDRGLHLSESVHEQAGQLLRILHESTLGAGDPHAHAAENTLRYIDYVDRVLERIDSLVLAGHRAVIRHRLVGLREALPQLPVAFCHGSFGFGAWRWQRVTRSLALTGFERSQVMAAVLDFARPSLLWAEYPALQDAFTRGYGRSLHEWERRLLGDFAVLAAIEDLWHTNPKDDAKTYGRLAGALRTAAGRLPVPETVTAVRSTEAPTG